MVAPNLDSTCLEHSGCIARISTLERSVTQADNRINEIFTRLNVILGGTVVACLLLVVNILIEVSK